MHIKLPVFALIMLLAVVLAYLFWPLASKEFAIQYDNQAVFEKEEFLSQSFIKDSLSRPNIVLITVDDLGIADCSLYGEGNIQTPNIDRLGEEGVVFENAYTTSPVCAPSRAALITGRYQQRYGFEYTIHERYLSNRLEYLGFNYFIDSYPWKPRWVNAVPSQDEIEKQGLPASEITLAEYLKKAGYATGIVGKWHLGYDKEHVPSNFGFDEQFGFFSSHTLYAYEGTPGIVDQKIEADWTDPFIWSGQREDEHAIFKNNVEIREEKYLTDRITEESIAFMEKEKEAPFFIWISYNAPHTPLQAPQEYLDMHQDISDPIKRIYAAMIHSLDDNIGKVMSYLTKNGLDENTLVFFISDNGGAEYTMTTDNGLYGGGKNTEFEGGVKVPMALRWNNVVSAGQRFQPMVCSMDIFSTAMAAANTFPMPGRPVDGVDLLPFLNASTTGKPHEYIFWQRGISKAVRTNEWKLLFNDKTGVELLYNLNDNKYESPDMAATQNEIVRQLRDAHAAWRQTHAKPLWPAVIYYYAIKDGQEYCFEQ